MSDRPGDTEPAAVTIDRRILDDALIIEVAGEIDLDSAPVLDAALTDALDRGSHRLYVVDLAEVEFIDSIGLSALLTAARHAQDTDGTLRVVVDANRPVIRPLEITGLDDVLSLHHTVDEALGH
ncbi:STAS domain-containing protein [Saccharothrix sp. S26]|uniref:STAS domain-containing protein n=1 Tax=Saccharothrix sp. S26 TaxID=2907215 RepID=UPI001F3504D0|nr:STAS domain-containing protein [Saccharothrix sp. S26]MCE6996143.1 STAS domain-containing protein [Saccharothrix sp. S26]